MRGAALVLVAAAWAGCGTTVAAGPRFEVGPARSLGGAVAEPLAGRVGGAANEHRAELISCLDDLRARRDAVGQQRVTLSIAVRAGSPTVGQVQSRDPATIVDNELVACLAGVVSGWSLVATSAAATADGDVELQVEVGPRPGRARAQAREGALAEVDHAEAARHTFRPAE